MKWTEEHEVLMLRELILMRPWQHRKGTSERGDDWEKLAVSLNAISNPQFRDLFMTTHYSTMEKRRRKKVREESCRDRSGRSSCRALVNHHEKINRITRKVKYITFVANRVLRKRRTGLGTGSFVTHTSHGLICYFCSFNKYLDPPL
ncbi:uncharacterized protein LOC141860035 isoform X2 [Acropora palmata]|uniref:uncharacterized protein LOC141860035 isoform X2 n=1 Tax=Acropora palmata TaxID=6131 RepID=UPI003DA13CEF